MPDDVISGMERTGKIFVLILACQCLLYNLVMAQPLAVQLKDAVQKLSADPQMKHATWSLVVADAASGKIIFDYNGQAGLAPASTQKIITSITAFELLAKDFRYETRFGFRGDLQEGILTGDLILQASGDPSFGSSRYAGTGCEKILQQIVQAVTAKGIRQIRGNVLTDTLGWNNEPIPDAWIWQDIGNYYGAGSWKFNWNENQYDVFLKSGPQPGSAVDLVSTKPVLAGIELKSQLVAGAQGSGDNAYIYLPPFASNGVIRGTIPPGKESFTVSGSMPDPAKQFIFQLKHELLVQNVQFSERAGNSGNLAGAASGNIEYLFTHQSPPLDSLAFWFLRKSINLYGESLLKTMGLQTYGEASTQNGVKAMTAFWKKNGIEAGALQLMDGSGLSPQNRITAMALVQSLQYARKREWFPSFYQGLPVYNGMKLKSGSINGSRAFAGYHTSRAGKTYTLAILVNNYSGSSTSMVKKMFLVLDHLK